MSRVMLLGLEDEQISQRRFVHSRELEIEPEPENVMGFLIFYPSSQPPNKDRISKSLIRGACILACDVSASS